MEHRLIYTLRSLFVCYVVDLWCQRTATTMTTTTRKPNRFYAKCEAVLKWADKSVRCEYFGLFAFSLTRCIFGTIWPHSSKTRDSRIFYRFGQCHADKRFFEFSFKCVTIRTHQFDHVQLNAIFLACVFAYAMCATAAVSMCVVAAFSVDWIKWIITICFSFPCQAT